MNKPPSPGLSLATSVANRIGAATFASLSALASLALCASLSAQGTLNLHWQFDQMVYTVEPWAKLEIRATLFNDPTSTASLAFDSIGAGVGGSFTGDLQKTYTFTWGPTSMPTDYWKQFAGLNLAPGQSFGYVVGKLAPIGGYASPGTYDFARDNYTDLSITPFGHPELLLLPRNSFTIQVIPEPAPLACLALGALGLTGHLGASLRGRRGRRGRR